MVMVMTVTLMVTSLLREQPSEVDYEMVNSPRVSLEFHSSEEKVGEPRGSMDLPLLIDMKQHLEDPGGLLMPRALLEADFVCSLQTGKHKLWA